MAKPTVIRLTEEDRSYLSLIQRETGIRTISEAVRFSVRETARRYSLPALLEALVKAPVGEPPTAEELESIREAEEQIARGEGTPWEIVEARLCKKK
ncbi:MAG: hypothetical protein M1358_22235 [Chloroflexi bacterium]|nr:hypothetical protein [Chloroflexota bacterium]